MRDMTEKQFLATLERHGIGAPDGVLLMCSIPTANGGTRCISLINYADAEYKINYRRALAALLREKDMVEQEVEASRSRANV
jgi:hypothetical protein